jgi:hypothetical protein
MTRFRMTIAVVIALAFALLGLVPGAASASPAAPHAPAGWGVVYAHDFATQGAGNWKADPWYSSAPVLESSQNGLGVDITAPGQKTWVVYSPANPYFIGPDAFVQGLVYIPEAANGQVANWPAFWTSGDPWPENGEIDMLEGLGGSACVHTHYETAQGEAGPSGGCASPPLGTGWVTVSMLRENGEVKVWYDSAYIGEAPLPTSALEELIFSDESDGGGPYAAGTAWLRDVTVSAPGGTPVVTAAKTQVKAAVSAHELHLAHLAHLAHLEHLAHLRYLAEHAAG